MWECDRPKKSALRRAIACLISSTLSLIPTPIAMIEIHQWRYELGMLFERDGFQS